MASQVGRHGLNFGCGPEWASAPPQWIGFDVIDYGQHEIGDVRDGLGFDDQSFDGIVANHSLQCLTYADVDGALREFHRVLRPGGRLRVLVPDVMGAVSAYLDSDSTWPGFVAISEPWSIDRKFGHYLTWGGGNRSCFTAVSLAEALDRAGFLPTMTNDRWWAWLQELDSREGESIVAEVQA